MDSKTLTANAASYARLIAGILGGILAKSGIDSEDGALETVIGSVIVAAAGIWALVKNAAAAKAKAAAEANKGKTNEVR